MVCWRNFDVPSPKRWCGFFPSSYTEKETEGEREFIISINFLNFRIKFKAPIHYSHRGSHPRDRKRRGLTEISKRTKSKQRERETLFKVVTCVEVIPPKSRDSRDTEEDQEREREAGSSQNSSNRADRSTKARWRGHTCSLVLCEPVWNKARFASRFPPRTSSYPFGGSSDARYVDDDDDDLPPPCERQRAREKASEKESLCPRPRQGNGRYFCTHFLVRTISFFWKPV
uniref:(northern house mosquito) hypothetical protein n=1 Tax=Culex pipiens TaxID=7175 RepID=A0A8D8G288_CULPI